jgi:hypothetical protein
MPVADWTPSSSDLRFGAGNPTLSLLARDIADTLTAADQAWIVLVAVVSDHCVAGVVAVLVSGCRGSGGQLRDSIYAVALAGLFLYCNTAAAWEIVRKCRGRGWNVGVGEGAVDIAGIAAAGGAIVPGGGLQNSVMGCNHSNGSVVVPAVAVLYVVVQRSRLESVVVVVEDIKSVEDADQLGAVMVRHHCCDRRGCQDFVGSPTSSLSERDYE